jgi:hypothetical protein
MQIEHNALFFLLSTTFYVFIMELIRWRDAIESNRTDSGVLIFVCCMEYRKYVYFSIYGDGKNRVKLSRAFRCRRRSWMAFGPQSDSMIAKVGSLHAQKVSAGFNLIYKRYRLNCVFYIENKEITTDLIFFLSSQYWQWGLLCFTFSIMLLLGALLGIRPSN